MIARLLKFLSDWYNGRVYYVVLISDPESPSSSPQDVAICDCDVFGGIEDFGLFYYKSDAQRFAAWRSNCAPYGQGYVYTVHRTSDEQLDNYLNDLESARGQVA